MSPPDAGFAFFSPCGADEYCNAVNCQQGRCTTKPTGPISSSRNPQCGCNRVTYWNPEVAAAAGEAIAFDGECEATVECGGINAAKCPPQALCNLMQFSQNECQSSSPVGTCWALPPDCPRVSANITTHSCTLNICIDQCSLIRQHQLWYTDPSCLSFTP